MPTIDITREHALSVDRAKGCADRLIKEMENRLGLFGILGRWDSDTLVITAPGGTAKGTEGAISVTAHAMRVTLDLPPVLLPMRGAVDKCISDATRRFLLEA